MNFAEYISGTWKKQFEYRSFSPTPVNELWQWTDPKIDTLLAEAYRRLGELNGLSLIVPNLDHFIQMHVIKEAQTSSQIEGTQTGLEEAIQEDPNSIAPENRNDWQEVRNYVTAMNQAIDEMKSLPLSNRLLRNAHRILMSGVRGEQKTPGEWRRSQNWIGGSSIADAVFIPPHHDELPMLMTDLEAFWHNEAIEVPQLIRIAISHYQFETIHPFLDGNGRIGRLLITLYLVNKGLLQQPGLYLSAHLEKNRAAYYDSLSRVRESNDMNHWIRFFLVGLIETARKGVMTFRSILDLQNRTNETLGSLGRATPNASRIVDYLYLKPIVTSVELTDRLKMTRSTVDRLIALLLEKKILSELTGQKRNRIFYFKDYFDLFLN